MKTKWFLILSGLLVVAPVMVQAQVNYAVSGNTAYVTNSPDAAGEVVIASTYNGYPVTSIGELAFFSTLLNSVTIPNSITNIGDEAFYDCSSLASATIGSHVTSIGYGVFEDCSSLTNVTIPNSVTNIGDEAFAECHSLASVTIPDSVTSIVDGAFESCYNLKSAYFQGNAPPDDGTVFVNGDVATVYYLPGTTGWTSTFGSAPTAPWTLPYPVILNNNPSFGVKNGQFGFTISWATNLSIVVEACTNLANPVWMPIAANALAGGTNYFSDPQWTNFPTRFYRAAGAFTVGGTLTGLPAGDIVTLRDNGGDNLTLSNNGTFTFPTALPNGQSYSVTLYTLYATGVQVACTFANGGGNISGANVTNVAVSCYDVCPELTGNMDEDMYNAAVSDGTANGGVPGVMLTEYGGPFRVTAIGTCSENVALTYDYWAWFDITVGSNSCSSTTFPSGTPVIAFGYLVGCGVIPYDY